MQGMITDYKQSQSVSIVLNLTFNLKLIETQNMSLS